MAERKTDRRTLKTQKALRDAMAQLLSEKQLHKVTVQEIADLAEVNRVTFYKHYLDVYDLYDKLESDVLVELGLLILRLGELSEEEFYDGLLTYISENSSIFKMMFSPNSTGTLRDKFAKLMEGLFRQMTTEEGISEERDMIEYYGCYRAQGCLAVIGRWVAGGLSLPKERVKEILSELDGNTAALMM